MVERKYLAHYVDTAFDMTYAACNYQRLGKDLEEFNAALGPEVSIVKNILGEQSVRHSGYEVQESAAPFYYDYDDDLSEKLMEIAQNRQSGDQCKTTLVDVLLNASGAVIKAWREDVKLVPESVGGDTTGIQIPFNIYHEGNRVEGTFDLSTKKFSAST